MCGSARESYLQMLDPVHNQCLGLCLWAFRTSPVESLHVDTHKPCLDMQYDSTIKERKEGKVLFNDALDTLYLLLYGVGHMVKDRSGSERGNPLPSHGLLFPFSSKGYFIFTIPQKG